jgi:hypothetical protein
LAELRGKGFLRGANVRAVSEHRDAGLLRCPVARITTRENVSDLWPTSVHDTDRTAWIGVDLAEDGRKGISASRDCRMALWSLRIS